MENTSDSLFVLMILVLVGFIIFSVFYINVFIPFKNAQREIKMEIARSDGEELDFWQGELKKLYISKIPIFRIIYFKFINK